LFDKELANLYTRMNSAEAAQKITSLPFKIVSIGGGLKDEFIEENWTRADYVLHASSTSLDRVWIEADHKCIIW